MIETARDMFIAFLHGIQKEDAEGVPAEKFNYWINKAQEDWLTERSKQFDQEQKRVDDLYLLRTERIVNTNGTRTVNANSTLRIMSDGSGTFEVQPERYFNISGLAFFRNSNNTGFIDKVSGEVTGAVDGDIYYAIIWYSELDYPVVSVIEITDDSGTIVTTHEGTKIDTSGDDYSGYQTVAYGAAVTFTDTGDTVGLNSHGYGNGRKVMFTAITTTTGISTGIVYYVINTATHTFKLSLTLNGDPVTLTTNGTGYVATVVDSDWYDVSTSLGLTDNIWPEDGGEVDVFADYFTDYRFLVPNGFPNPKYFRLMNVLFKVTYQDNAIFEDGESNWLKAQLMRADQRADIYQNAYRFPTDEKPYYRLLGEFIEFVSETDSTPLKMKIEYLRYPLAIKYVEPLSDDVAIDCELQPIQQKEIVDMAVRMYIEATQSPRYQSQIVEEQIKDKIE